jgi:hypothetical protein
MTAGGHENFVQRIGGRTLADQIRNPAGVRLAIQHRRRAMQHVDAFEPVGVEVRHGVAKGGRTRQAGAVQVLFKEKATAI